VDWRQVDHRVVGPIYRVAFLSYIFVSYIWPALVVAGSAVSTFFVAQYFGGEFVNYIPRILISGGAALLVALLLRRQSSRHNRNHKIADDISRCVAAHIEFKDEVFSVLSRRMASENKAYMISELCRNHSIFLCERLAEIFHHLIGEPCHANFKSLDGTTVITRARDALSHNSERNKIDEALNSYTESGGVPECSIWWRTAPAWE